MVTYAELGAQAALRDLGLSKYASAAHNAEEPVLFTHDVHGLKVDIARPKGHTRVRNLPDGTVLKRTMAADYGDMPGYTVMDKDNLDAFVGPDPESRKVYLFHLLNDGKDGKKFVEEQKVFLGFPNRQTFQHALHSTFTTPEYRGPVYAMDIDKFKRRLEETPPGERLRR